MAWSYNRLWHLLIEKDIKRTSLIKAAGLNSYIITKMSKRESVPLDAIGKLCEHLDCRVEDIVEYIPEKTSGEASQ